MAREKEDAIWWHLYLIILYKFNCLKTTNSVVFTEELLPTLICPDVEARSQIVELVVLRYRQEAVSLYLVPIICRMRN